MNNLAKIFILLIIVLSSSVFFAQTTNNMIISSVDTLTINVSNDSLTIDTTTQNTLVSTSIDSSTMENSAIDTVLYRSIMLYRDSISYNLKKPYNKDVFKFKYDSFKEKMKEPWIGDILKDFFFR